jgi:hypothetical protein
VWESIRAKQAATLAGRQSDAQEASEHCRHQKVMKQDCVVLKPDTAAGMGLLNMLFAASLWVE